MDRFEQSLDCHDPRNCIGVESKDPMSLQTGGAVPTRIIQLDENLTKDPAWFACAPRTIGQFPSIDQINGNRQLSNFDNSKGGSIVPFREDPSYPRHAKTKRSQRFGMTLGSVRRAAAGT